MATITLPKEIQEKKDLVAVPKDEYREFLVWQKKIKSQRTFQPTKAERQVLERGRKNLFAGAYTGLSQLKHELGSRHR